MSGQRILILGGYGEAGRKTAELVLLHTSWPVRLVGRNAEKLTKVAGTLQADHGAERVDLAVADVADSDAVRGALEGVRCCLVMVPTRQIGGGIADLCAEVGVDLIDISLWPSTVHAYREDDARYREAGITVVSQAGLIPGIPAVMVGQAAATLDSLKQVTIGEALSLEPVGSLSTAEELLASLSLKAFIFQDGEWRKPKGSGARKIDFGEPFGVKKAYPYDLMELRDLPERYELESLAMYSGGFGGRTDALFLFILALRMNRGVRRLRWSARRFLNSIKRNAKPPFGIYLQLEGEGDKGGEPQRVNVRVGHEKAYVATGAPVVACLKQLYSEEDSIRRPGSHLMGHILDPARTFADLEAMGMEVSVTCEAIP